MFLVFSFPHTFSTIYVHICWHVFRNNPVSANTCPGFENKGSFANTGTLFYLQWTQNISANTEASVVSGTVYTLWGMRLEWFQAAFTVAGLYVHRQTFDVLPGCFWNYSIRICNSISGVRQTDTSIVVLAGIVVYVVVVWHWLGGGLTRTPKLSPKETLQGAGRYRCGVPKCVIMQVNESWWCPS